MPLSLYVSLSKYSIFSWLRVVESKNESLPSEEGNEAQKSDFQSLLSQVDRLESELEIERKNNAEQIIRMKYLQADLINLQRQSDRLVSEARNEARMYWIIEIISIKEDLERAIKSSNEKSVLIDGLKLLLTRIENKLNSEGVEEINADLGTMFDPKFHDAVSFQESEDKLEGSIVEVIAPGYIVSGKVIRPTLVEIARKSSATSSGKKEKNQDSWKL